MRQRALGRGKLHEPEQEGAHCREGVKRDCGCGLEQRRQGHEDSSPTPTRLPATGSERDVVVHVTVAAAGTCRNCAPRRRTARAEIATRLIRESPARPAAATIEHGEAGVEALQHHFGCVLLGARLVGPFARLQLAFEINLGALLQILLGDLAQTLVEDHDAVPLGLFLAFAGCLVAPAFGGRDTQIGDRPAVLRPPDLRILAEVSDQNHLVHAARHRHSPNLTSTAGYAARPASRWPPTLYAWRRLSGRKGAPVPVIHI